MLGGKVVKETLYKVIETLCNNLRHVTVDLHLFAGRLCHEWTETGSEPSVIRL